MFTVRVKCDFDGIRKATKILSEGGIVIFPTDTVYGIGCDPFDKNAVDKIYRIKNRERTKPLPILVHSKNVAAKIAEFDSTTEKIVDRMWPGPLTILLKIRDQRLKETLGTSKKIAVRSPNHKCVLDLLSHCRYMIGTSANISGTGSTTNPDECEKDMSDYNLLLDGGTISGGMESTIVETVGEKIMIHRAGKIKKEEILDIL